MSPTHLPSPARNRHLRRFFSNPLSAAAAISFSLTFVGAGVALLFGLVPSNLAVGAQQIDTGVVVLLVPLCALMLAILLEAVRATLNNGIADTPAPRANALSRWKPGQGEG